MKRALQCTLAALSILPLLWGCASPEQEASDRPWNRQPKYEVMENWWIKGNDNLLGTPTERYP